MIEEIFRWVVLGNIIALIIVISIQRRREHLDHLEHLKRIDDLISRYEDQLNNPPRPGAAQPKEDSEH